MPAPLPTPPPTPDHNDPHNDPPQHGDHVQLRIYPGYSGPRIVTGYVHAYLDHAGHANLHYSLHGVEDECKTTPEGVANACGIHIHEGKTCDDASAVGGHYYATESDPWGALGYKSNSYG